MDEKAFLLQEIRYSKRKQNVKKFLRYESVGIAAGGTIAIALEGLSVFVPFYTVHVWAVLAILCGAAAGAIYTVKKRCTMAQAAQQIDRFGFQERILTAYERIGKEDDFDRMQRSDAVHMLKENRAWQKVQVCPDRRKLAALGLSLGLALVLSFVPAPARKQAQQRHAIRQEAREKEKEIQDVMDALKQTDTSSMTKEQKKALQELIQSLALSQKEMQQADTKQSLASAEQKLSYKYEQAAQTSGADVLASALKNVQANANAGNQFAKGGDGGKNQAHGGTQSTAQNGTQSGESTQASDNGSQASGDGKNSDCKKNGNGSGNGKGKGNGSGNGNGNSSGNGNGNSSGTGSGNGNGNGNGTGNGSGTGGGRGTGSGGGTHDYVSVPNKIGNDSSIAKDKGDSKNSDYYKAKNGLAWKGEHVDLDSVVGDYTKEAYEGIANGKYPAGMEDVIRNYFENLN